jgi:hypothetical protein
VCSQFGFFSPFDSSLWLFGESSAHNLVSSPLLILLIALHFSPFDSSDCIALLPIFDSSDCTSPTFDDSLVTPLLVLMYGCISLFDWLMVMVLAVLSTKITHFGWLLLSIGFADS